MLLTRFGGEECEKEREKEDEREALASELEQSRADLREVLSESEAQRVAMARERRERSPKGGSSNHASAGVEPETLRSDTGPPRGALTRAMSCSEVLLSPLIDP